MSVCDLLTRPALYDHRLIEITGEVTFGLENFTLSSKECATERPQIWLDYGGTLKTGAIPDGLDQRRAQPLTIERISTQLIEDANFGSFDAAIHKLPIDQSQSTLRATLVGRYFAGKPGAMGVERWRGFGMYGMYSLLVIQQVMSPES